MKKDFIVKVLRILQKFLPHIISVLTGATAVSLLDGCVGTMFNIPF